ncbi:hypothetical protein DFH07DRAFT_969383 [Mycena maculata]|uniref:Secreted protein n=1 Tax=Mycena maculata TaxID=230809 RepID=A0AAD7HWH8_9AGAR|nr:hypothetical protein DFH07DRAFT_969383 [Mycena maculata]
MIVDHLRLSLLVVLSSELAHASPTLVGEAKGRFSSAHGLAPSKSKSRIHPAIGSASAEPGVAIGQTTSSDVTQRQQVSFPWWWQIRGGAGIMLSQSHAALRAARCHHQARHLCHIPLHPKLPIQYPAAPHIVRSSAAGALRPPSLVGVLGVKRDRAPMLAVRVCVTFALFHVPSVFRLC